MAARGAGAGARGQQARPARRAGAASSEARTQPPARAQPQHPSRSSRRSATPTRLQQRLRRAQPAEAAAKAAHAVAQREAAGAVERRLRLGEAEAVHAHGQAGLGRPAVQTLVKVVHARQALQAAGRAGRERVAEAQALQPRGHLRGWGRAAAGGGG
jgi:hypothetical protein